MLTPSGLCKFLLRTVVVIQLLPAAAAFAQSPAGSGNEAILRPAVSTLQESLAKAQVEEDAGKTLEAVNILEAALQQAQATGKKDRHIQEIIRKTGELYGKLGASYISAGKYTQAEPLLQDAIRIKKEALFYENLELASLLSSIAVVYERAGDNDQAEAAFKQALTLREANLGPKNQTVANGLINLAEFYGRNQRPAEAVPLFKRAISIL